MSPFVHISSKNRIITEINGISAKFDKLPLRKPLTASLQVCAAMEPDAVYLELARSRLENSQILVTDNNGGEKKYGISGRAKITRSEGMLQVCVQKLVPIPQKPRPQGWIGWQD